MLIVCVTSAAQRRCASRFRMRSSKICFMYPATSSLATKRPRRIRSDCNARENSRAVLNRSPRFFASAFITIFSRSIGYPRTTTLGRSGLHSWTFAIVSRSLSIRKSRCPVVSSQRTTPSAKMSSAPVYPFSVHLLRAHVSELPFQGARARTRHPRAELRDAEVDDLGGAVVGDKEVVWRHIAVDEAELLSVLAEELMRRVEPFCCVGDHATRDLRRHRRGRAPRFVA